MAMTYLEAYPYLARGMRIICEPEGDRLSWEATFEEFTGDPEQPIRASRVEGKTFNSGDTLKIDTFHVKNCAFITILTERDGVTPFRPYKYQRATESQEWKMRMTKVPKDSWKESALNELYNMQVDKSFLRGFSGPVYNPLSTKWVEKAIKSFDSKLTKKGNTPVKLSVMQKLLMAKDDQTLTKAGYLDGDMDLTEEGQEALDSILFAANKEALVKLAQAKLDEEAAESKK